MKDIKASAETVKEIVNLYQSGDKISVLSEKFNLCPNTISTYLKQNVVKTRTCIKKINPEHIEIITKMYLDNIPVVEIAEKFEIHRSTVIKYLRKNGVKIRPCIRKINLEQIEVITRMYLDNIPIVEIAEKFKIHRSTVIEYLRNNNIEIIKNPTSAKTNSIKKNSEEMIKLYEKGLSSIKIAEKFGFSVESVLKVLKKNNITIRDGLFKTKLSKQEQDKVAKLYISGKSSTELSRELEINRSTIKKILKKRNIKVRGNKGKFKFKKDHIDKMLELYKKGLAISKIAKLFGCTDPTVKSYLERNDIKTRYGRCGKIIRKGRSAKDYPCSKNPIINRSIVHTNLDIVRSAPEDVYRLDLSNQDLYDLPLEVLNCHNLRYLNLSNNYLDNIPVDIYKLFKLRIIDLRDNNLSNLPDEFFELSKLENLNLEKNFFTELPDQIRFLYKLKFFNASLNKLNIFPSSLLTLKYLKEIHLHENNIKRLPNSMDKLNHLEKLNLNGNKIDSSMYNIGC